ncbi:hypothetical protein BD779DRAFT_1805211 [Infundibulicybe gibba]|nr:hypothetical protein BD779DRAFT_1805211 [Infundibulicybe gibba]
MPGDMYTSQVEPTFEETWGVVVVSQLVAGSSQWMRYRAGMHLFQQASGSLHSKCMVAYIWLGCVTLAVCGFWVIHGVIITGYHLPPEEAVISLGFSIVLVITVTTIGTTQGIYVLRMYKFGHNRYLLVCCCALIGMEVGTGFAWARQVAHAAPEWQVAMQESRWIITTSVVSSVVLDIFIAISMCYQLWRSRMMGLKRTRHLVDKLMRWTIQTGAFTSVVGIAMILVENFGGKTNFYLVLGVGFVSPNCYALGLLAFLNARTGLDELDTDHLCLPTVTTSLVWARSSKSAEVPVTHSGSTLGDERATVELSRGDLIS